MGKNRLGRLAIRGVTAWVGMSAVVAQGDVLTEPLKLSFLPTGPGHLAMTTQAEGELPAGLKHYNFLQEGGLLTPGQVQIEQDFGLQHRLSSNHSFISYSGLTQAAYSVDDRFMVTVIFASYSYFDNGDTSAFRYDTSGGQLYYALTDPDKDGVGVSLFQAALVGPEVVSLDSRLIVVKPIDKWDITYNLRVGNDFGGIDGGGVSTTGTLGNVLGLSYVFSPGLVFHEVSVGGEFTFDCIFDEWRRYTDTNIYAGPVVGVTFARNWSLTVTGLFQVSDNDVPRFLLAGALIFSY